MQLQENELIILGYKKHLIDMKTKIEQNLQTFYIKDLLFGVWIEMLFFRKLDLKLEVQSTNPYTIRGLDPESWFTMTLGDKVVFRSDQVTEELQNCPWFNIMTVRDLSTHYIVDTLFKILVKLNTDESVVIKSLSIL